MKPEHKKLLRVLIRILKAILGSKRKNDEQNNKDSVSDSQ